ELLHLEPAVILHDLIEDVLHDMGIDQVAFRFDHFLEWHQTSIVAAARMWLPPEPGRLVRRALPDSSGQAGSGRGRGKMPSTDRGRACGQSCAAAPRSWLLGRSASRGPAGCRPR